MGNFDNLEFANVVKPRKIPHFHQAGWVHLRRPRRPTAADTTGPATVKKMLIDAVALFCLYAIVLVRVSRGQAPMRATVSNSEDLPKYVFDSVPR